MNSMVLAAVQFCPEPGKNRLNAEKIKQFIIKAAEQDADLAVFPECSLTGYSTDSVDEFAVERNCEETAAIRKVCSETKTTVCFGYIEKADGSFITQEITDGCHSVFYRKTHLGIREKRVFREGSEFPVFFGNVRMGMQLCWESHIPEISSAEREKGAELLLVPYASPMSGEKCSENWSVHLPARASDNGVFLAACNLLFTPKDNRGEIRGGGLAVYDPKGRRIASYFGTDEHMVLCRLEGKLPRETDDTDMRSISYFDRKRYELF